MTVTRLLSRPSQRRHFPKPIACTHLPVKLPGVLLPQRPEVGLGYLPPSADYFQNLLRHTSPKGVDRVGMAETVGMHVLDIGAVRQALQDLAYPVGQQSLALLRHPKCLGVGHEDLSFLEIIPHDGPGCVADRHPPFFSSLAHHKECAIGKIHLIKSQLSDFGESPRRVPKRVQECPVANQAKSVSGRSGEGGVSKGEQVPHLVFGDYGNRLLLQLGRADREHGVFVVGPAFHQPIEKTVQAAVLGVDVALGQLPGFGVGPLPKPTYPVLEVGEVLLDVG